MNRRWWRGWRSWTSDAQLVTHTSACRRTHTSASPCHTSATRRAADVGFVIYPTGVVGSSEEVRRFAFSHEKNRFHNFTLHDYITHRLHDYTTTILRLLSSLYIYIYIGSSLLSPIFQILSHIPYFLSLAVLHFLLSPPSCRSSLLAALCYLLSDHPIFSLSTLPLIVL